MRYRNKYITAARALSLGTQEIIHTLKHPDSHKNANTPKVLEAPNILNTCEPLKNLIYGPTILGVPYYNYSILAPKPYSNY